MKKYYIIILFLIFGFNYQNAFCGCEYQGKIDECVQANKEEGGARNITDYVCKDTEPENVEGITYQIIFDDKFKIIDKDVENFLETLQNSIQYYYGPNKKESFLDGINYINELFNPSGLLSKRYRKFCLPKDDNSILSNYYECIGGDDSQKISSIKESSEYFSQSSCDKLVETKLLIYKKVAYNLLQVNKLDFLKEFRKKQMKTTREAYDKVIGNMYVNLDNIIRINNQREKVTKQCDSISPSS